MSLDLSNLSPSARTSYLVLGKQYSSGDTLAQANLTLQGLAAHAQELVPHGFAPEDATRLQDARDAISAATVDRIAAQGGKKVTNATYVRAMAAGKMSRSSALSVLHGARSTLNDQSDPASMGAVKLIDATLSQTRAAGADAEKLAAQLDTLRAVFNDPAVTAASATRGGPATVTDLEAKAITLRSASVARSGSAGTPKETEELDVLDGLIVTLARQARRAARAASKRLGKPAIAAAFELTRLYNKSGTPRPADGATPPEDHTPPNG